MCGGCGAVQGGAGGGEGGAKGRYHCGSVRIHIYFISQLLLLIKWTALSTFLPDMKESFYVGDAVSIHEWSTVRLWVAFYSG